MAIALPAIAGAVLPAITSRIGSVIGGGLAAFSSNSGVAGSVADAGVSDGQAQGDFGELQNILRDNLTMQVTMARLNALISYANSAKEAAGKVSV